MNRRDLQGRVALITGGARGIGRAIAERLASQGARVAVADIDGEEAETVGAALRGGGFALDVRDSHAVEATVSEVVARYGRLDIVVNNAGVHVQKLAVDLSDADWNTIFETNARGCFFVSRACAPHLMDRGSGRIINIITRLGGNPYSSAYIASKSAIWGFTQCLALELAPYDVTVNAVAPGHIPTGTGMEKWFRAKAELLQRDWDRFEADVLKSIPLGRWCTPDDVAAAVAFLASDDAGFITGEQLNVTGGWTAYGATPPRTERESEGP